MVVTADEVVVGELAFPCRASKSGNNYLAEAVASLAAMLSIPSEADLTICTNSLSALQAAARDRVVDWSTGELIPEYELPQRARILTAARPVLSMTRAVIWARKGRTVIAHVRAHTGGSDIRSRMNERADQLANVARLLWKGRAADLPLDLYGEERFRVLVNGVPVVGGVSCGHSSCSPPPGGPGVARGADSRRCGTSRRYGGYHGAACRVRAAHVAPGGVGRWPATQPLSGGTEVA